MTPFRYRNGTLHAEDVPLANIAAEHGTPAYVYSRGALEAHWRAYDQAFEGVDHLICYAVKANSNLAVLDTLARLGSGFDILRVYGDWTGCEFSLESIRAVFWAEKPGPIDGH